MVEATSTVAAASGRRRARARGGAMERAVHGRGGARGSMADRRSEAGLEGEGKRKGEAKIGFFCVVGGFCLVLGGLAGATRVLSGQAHESNGSFRCWTSIQLSKCLYGIVEYIFYKFG
jgi:hypothetical protein